ncbi:hypothetical protein GHT06_003857 [Daphnia sinensis]|uniref:Uncharacterized protein n=1 Tax=Daphnia sinensis TaxID=1820382 RepID=A0AAD5KTV3_9CRUS|nr:hypothetical protein GHT06_003857 [Daphnia sinensis]
MTQAANLAVSIGRSMVAGRSYSRSSFRGGKASLAADGIWVNWNEQVGMQAIGDEDDVASLTPGSYRLTLDEYESRSRLYRPNGLLHTYTSTWYPRTGTNGAWWTCRLLFGPVAIVVQINQGSGWSTLHRSTVTEAPPLDKPRCVVISARTGGQWAEHAVRNITMLTRDTDTPSRDAQFLAINEIEFPSHFLVRRSWPPRDAVTFGVHVDLGPIYGGFCVTNEHGLLPCKITVGGVAYYATDTSKASYNFFYVVPKPGYVATRARQTGGPPGTAIYVDCPRHGAATRSPLYLIVLERSDTVMYGRYEPGGSIVCEHSGVVTLTDDGSWEYVCIEPMVTVYKWVLLPLGMGCNGSETSPGAWASSSLDLYAIAAEGERRAAASKNPCTAIDYRWGPADTREYFFKTEGWPIKTSTVPKWACLLRADAFEAAKPPYTVSGASYTSTNYTDSTRNLVWRWHDNCGWYLNMNMKTA